MTNQQQNTASDRANQLLVEGLLGAGRQEEAISLCRRICYTPGAGPRDWLMYGCLCADTGDAATARTALKKAIELAPDLVEAWFALGKLQLATGRVDGAITRLEKAAQMQPDNAEIWLALGIACGLAKKLDKSEECCRRSVELRPGSAPARFNLANALQGQGKLGEAEIEYQAALNIEPGMTAAWSMLAQARLGLRKYEDAESAANRALALDPRTGEAHHILGMIADALGETERARNHFQQAAHLLPKVPDVHWGLALVLMKLKEYLDATESLQAVLNISPDLAKVHAAMGECFYRRKLYGRAENCYRKALALRNDYYDAHLGLAFVMKEMRRDAEYEKQLVECLRMRPDESQVRHLLASLRGEATPAAPAEYVKQVFDGYADYFEDHLVGALHYHTPEQLHEMVTQVVAPAPGTMEIIDLGCGTGLCAPLFRGMARILHGVDLSPRMVEKARERRLYDTLEVGEITSILKSRVATWDMAIAADVLIYIGDLKSTFEACSSALRPGGFFAFSVENGDDGESFVLRKSGRYAHASEYIRSLSAAAGFDELERRPVVLRKEGGEDMQGYLFLLRRPPGAPETPGSHA